jgi:tetratricopeptide (TPR) repeat protein
VDSDVALRRFVPDARNARSIRLIPEERTVRNSFETMENTKVLRLAVTSMCILTMPMLIGCGLKARGDSDVEHAMGLYEQRKFAEAIPPLQSALGKPLRVYTRSEVLTTIGNCYNELKQFEESLDYHDRAISEDPKNHQAYVNKGVVYRLMGDYDQAAKLYSKALELAPDYAELHASMGALAIFQGDYQVAVDHLERAVALDDTLAIAHSNLAVAYASVGRFDEADRELKKAVIRGYHQPEVIKKKIEQLRNASDDES